MWLLVVLFLTCCSSAHGYDRIISLSPQLTESVYLLGAERSLVGVTEFCIRPEEVRKTEKVGTPLRPDMEKVVMLRPDLVIASREGTSPWAVKRMERLGLNIRYFARPKGLDGLLGNFLELASLLGKKKEGEGILRFLRAGLAELGGGTGSRTLWQVGADPLVVASTSSFANDIMVHAGCVNVVNTTIPYPRLNREEAILSGPALVVLTDMGYSVESEMKRWQAVLPGATYVVMDSYIVGSPTPLGFLEAVKTLRAAARGKEKKEQCLDED